MSSLSLVPCCDVEGSAVAAPLVAAGVTANLDPVGRKLGGGGGGGGVDGGDSTALAFWGVVKDGTTDGTPNEFDDSGIGGIAKPPALALES